MSHESNREDLEHTPQNAGKIDERHKQANQQGEQPRHPGHEKNEPVSGDQNRDKP